LQRWRTAVVGLLLDGNPTPKARALAHPWRFFQPPNLLFNQYRTKDTFILSLDTETCRALIRGHRAIRRHTKTPSLGRFRFFVISTATGAESTDFCIRHPDGQKSRIGASPETHVHRVPQRPTLPDVRPCAALSLILATRLPVCSAGLFYFVGCLPNVEIMLRLAIDLHHTRDTSPEL